MDRFTLQEISDMVYNNIDCIIESEAGINIISNMIIKHLANNQEIISMEPIFDQFCEVVTLNIAIYLMLIKKIEI